MLNSWGLPNYCSTCKLYFCLKGIYWRMKVSVDSAHWWSSFDLIFILSLSYHVCTTQQVQQPYLLWVQGKRYGDTSCPVQSSPVQSNYIYTWMYKLLVLDPLVSCIVLQQWKSCTEREREKENDQISFRDSQNPRELLGRSVFLWLFMFPLPLVTFI